MTQTQTPLFFVIPVFVGILLFATSISQENAYAENSFDIIIDTSQQSVTTNESTTQQEYASGYVFIKFKETPTITTYSSTEQQSTQNILVATSLENFESIDAKLIKLKDLSVQDAIDLYKDNPSIEYIEPDYIVSINAVPNDPYYSNLWGMDKINAPQAWDVEQGTDILVAVIDTGVDYTHEDLIDNIWTNSGEIPNNGIDDDGNGYIDDIHGYDFYNNDGDPYDDHYHGTHVSGTIAAAGNNNIGVIGVNPYTKIVGIKFLSSSGDGYTSGAINSIDYSVAIGAKISSNSWGGGGYSTSLYNAIANAQSSGQIFLAAAGNNGLNNDVYPHYPSSYNLDNIVSVASTTSSDGLSYFSNYGITSVDLGAPGSDIYSTKPGNNYDYLSGTSMATPHVSGVIALMLSVNPTLSVSETKQILLDSTNPVSYLNGNTVSGGLLDAHAAVLSVGAPNDCTSPSSGNWIVTQDCTISVDATINGGNLIVQNNSVLTIDNGSSLDVDLVNYHINVESGSGILVKAGSKIY